MDAHIPLIVDRSGTILNLTFNNPSKKNALNSEMMGAMTAAIEESSNYEELRAIVIRGEGSIFCSGADINTWEPEQLQLLLKTISECSIPTGFLDYHQLFCREFFSSQEFGKQIFCTCCTGFLIN